MSFLRFLSLVTWSLYSSSNTPHFKAGVKMVSSALCYNIFKHIRGREKKGQEYGIMRNEARKSVFRLRKCLGQISFSSFEKVWIEKISSHGALSKPWYDGCFTHFFFLTVTCGYESDVCGSNNFLKKLNHNRKNGL